ncbi:hypothetical protein AB0D46_34060 [Streptomyces sp. NPDC048383]|uniref:hypothetical protein n=1 Tax=Streptomyces sp. NPDC048383 TaxID=3155386 RepID=UPI00342742C1
MTAATYVGAGARGRRPGPAGRAGPAEFRRSVASGHPATSPGRGCRPTAGVLEGVGHRLPDAFADRIAPLPLAQLAARPVGR